MAKKDSMNNTTFGQDSIAKEMNIKCVAFNTLDNGQVSPVRHNRTSKHSLFVVKMDFIRKAAKIKNRIYSVSK